MVKCAKSKKSKKKFFWFENRPMTRFLKSSNHSNITYIYVSLLGRHTLFNWLGVWWRSRVGIPNNWEIELVEKLLCFLSDFSNIENLFIWTTWHGIEIQVKIMYALLFEFSFHGKIFLWMLSKSFLINNNVNGVNYLEDWCMKIFKKLYVRAVRLIGSRFVLKVCTYLFCVNFYVFTEIFIL